MSTTDRIGEIVLVVSGEFTCEQGIFTRICPAALQSKRVQCFLRPTAVGALEIAARRLRCDLVCLAAGLVTF